ncbi:MAG: S24/S26 family peptidase [Clostridia bacterium]|nr:S24/S26 family peptidase [Clostridia bacterium]
MRYVNTNEYVDVLRGLTEEGHEVSMLVSGSSMSPFICHQRDSIYFKKPDAPLKAGDMVFYQRESGQYIMHRILRAYAGEYDIVGDAQTEIERGVKREQIFAIVTRVKRKGKMIQPGDFWWEFFARVWTKMIPLRPVFAAAYARFIR